MGYIIKTLKNRSKLDLKPMQQKWSNSNLMATMWTFLPNHALSPKRHVFALHASFCVCPALKEVSRSCSDWSSLHDPHSKWSDSVFKVWSIICTNVLHTGFHSPLRSRSGKRPTQQATRQRQKRKEQSSCRIHVSTTLHATEKGGQLQQTQSLIFLSHSEGSEEILPSPLSLFSTESVSLATNICRNNNFVMTNIFLSQQKFCCDKQTFVATKMILVAPPANNTCVILLWLTPFCLCPPPPPTSLQLTPPSSFSGSLMQPPPHTAPPPPPQTYWQPSRNTLWGLRQLH